MANKDKKAEHWREAQARCRLSDEAITELQKAYQVNVKADAAQAYTIWESVAPMLMRQGRTKIRILQI